ncbi:MAG: ArnT family glycosyltransferase [Nitrospinales bacterium]
MQPFKPPPATAKLDVPLLAVWVLACFFALTWRLGEVPPYHTDESYYVESVETMVKSGDYLTPYYHGEKRFAKPILIYWIMAAAYKAFGFSPAVARLGSAVMGALCVALVFLLARRLFNRATAWLSALILPGFYLHFLLSRWATTDMTLNGFILAACYFFVCGVQDETNRKRNFILFYLAMALGFLTKGPPAVILPGATVFLFLAMTRRWRLFAQLRLFSGTLIILAVNLPWFTAMYVLHGDAFMNHLLSAEVRGRVFHDVPFSFYFLWVLIRYYLPWSLFAVAGLLACAASWFRKRDGGEQEQEPPANGSLLFCWLGILVPLALFSLLRIQHSRYMLPASPFIAILLGYYFTKLEKFGAGLRSPGFKIPFLLTLLFYGVAAVAVGCAVAVFFSIDRVPFGVYFLPVFLVFGVTVLIVLYLYKKKWPLIAAMAFVQIVTATLVNGEAIPFFNRYPMKKFAAEILKTGSAGTSGAPVAVYRLGNNGARLGVLTAHPVFDIQDPGELRRFVAEHKKVYVVMRETGWRETLGDDSLTLKARDTAWKTRRITPETLEAVWNRGLKTAVADYSESLALLARLDRHAASVPGNVAVQAAPGRLVRPRREQKAEGFQPPDQGVHALQHKIPVGNQGKERPLAEPVAAENEIPQLVARMADQRPVAALPQNAD